ncbi:hypothetical protein BRADI_2g48424v3 [Brachypodium distachyon]|uniref:Reverse transcriptase zinc-binding domain-containing protein n=1 Tax=Brachypodium distachyon TaxID=15368 RepID=A0A2K2DEP3_BRADI|nr:hypothetical protein BRADI_2g48424v3 [Brachypodium distachyon]
MSIGGRDLIYQKYLRGVGVFQASRRPGASACWSDLQYLKEIYLQGLCIIIGNGRTTDFWGDAWCGHTPLCQLFPGLFAISNNIIGVAAICWAIWKIHNKTCFEKKLIRSLAEIVCYACAFLRYWARLQNESKRNNLLAGAAALQAEALRHHEGQARVDKRKLKEHADDAGGDKKQKMDDEAV